MKEAARKAMTPEDLSERLLDFAARIGKVVDALPERRLGRHVAAQLVRSGTSPAKMAGVLDECTQLCRVIGQSIVTAKRRGVKKT